MHLEVARSETQLRGCKYCSVQDNADEFEKLDLQRVGVLVGTGMGGLQVFQDGVQNLVERGYKKISPFFIPYAITNMCAGQSAAQESGQAFKS